MTITASQKELQAFDPDETTQFYMDVLRTLISKKSIFAQQVGLKEVATYLAEVFEDSGADVLVDDRYTAPFVLAKFKSPHPDAKTIIFYNHYDTVPADDDQPWTSDPFTLTIREGYMYGRGVDDDKGHITARLTAVKKYLNEVGDLPVNVIFIMEGAEESASVDLEHYLETYHDQLVPADLLIWEQGIKNSRNQLEITGGNKGIVTFDLSIQSADVDIHSKYGGVIESASWRLLAALQSMRATDGRLLIDGIYEKVLPPNQRELDLVKQYALDNPEELQDIYGLTLPPLVTEQEAFLRRYFFEPSLTIEGLTSGYQGQGVKTILPSTASAKMEIRLVPGLTPDYALACVENHLQKLGFSDILVTYTLGEESYRSDLSAPAILRLIELAKAQSPAGVSVLPTSAGTGPMHKVHSSLGVPMASIGIGHPNSRDHGGDENVRLVDYYSHIQLVKELIASYESPNYCS